MSFSAGLNPNVVKTALDKVFMQEYDIPQAPDLTTARDPLCFHQSSADNAAEIMEVFKGTSKWNTRQEEEAVENDDPRITDQITFNVANYAKSVDITKNYFDDDMHGTVEMMIRDMGDTARITQDDTALALFRNAFTTTLCADGVALISDSHANINGDTIDNQITAVLSPTSLETAITTLLEQKNQAGLIRGHQPHVLLVPPALYKEAVEITDSELVSDSANNAVNVFSNKYRINIKQSPYLGAAAGGSDTAWFLLARNHSIYRWVRQPLVTNLIPWQYQRNNNYIYKGEYREMYGAVTYEGIVGSTGAG